MELILFVKTLLNCSIASSFKALLIDKLTHSTSTYLLIHRLKREKHNLPRSEPKRKLHRKHFREISTVKKLFFELFARRKKEVVDPQGTQTKTLIQNVKKQSQHRSFATSSGGK